MTSTVNIAILGSGLFALHAYLPNLLTPENKHINLHTVWSRSESSAQKLVDAAKEKSGGSVSPRLTFGDDGLETVLNDKEIQGVMLVLPIRTQMDLVFKCLKAGKHVLSEKPIGTDVAAARELVDEYEKTYKPKGLIWRVAEDVDHEPMVHKAAEKVRDPALGPVLYWSMEAHGYIEDASMYHATEWRTIPDYQGGFLLDGGVHDAALIRLVLPNPPEQIISSANLHRNHIPPHDIVQAIALSPSTETEAHGPASKLKGIRGRDEIPGGIGRSSSTGTIVFSFAIADLDSKPPKGIIVNCLNGTVRLQMVAGNWKLEVQPGKGTNVKPFTEEGKRVGVREECAYFARAIAALKDGQQVDEKESRGNPRHMLWDVALIEALLTSNGEKVDMQKLLSGK
ncbi:hypothetical protein BD324DRAFT_649946 [Kockovaella imperatae]|uniref:Uncharacterized protein n=1 Tax=Kockovaella imperatae TaxID=4999 RepID=A0A1Y1UM37_9TREE|nr:hypothetical protein BD324DRAFT_649946 [Kockovaella imperatae]ORX38587.1 hypothetical protein BD324DRAFT_649946 [Kockovaella imperatae]